MLKGLGFTNLTVFREADFRFGGGVNVIIGENGSGKSHLLRVAYALIAAAGAERNGPTSFPGPVKSTLQRTLATKLINVMRTGVSRTSGTAKNWSATVQADT